MTTDDVAFLVDLAERLTELPTLEAVGDENDVDRLLEIARSLEGFEDAPPTIGELRSDKTNRARDAKPRDCLVKALRLIDSGKDKPYALVIAYAERGEGIPETSLSFHCASPDIMTTLGLLTATINRIDKDSNT